MERQLFIYHILLIPLSSSIFRLVHLVDLHASLSTLRSFNSRSLFIPRMNFLLSFLTIYVIFNNQHQQIIMAYCTYPIILSRLFFFYNFPKLFPFVLLPDRVKSLRNREHIHYILKSSSFL